MSYQKWVRLAAVTVASQLALGTALVMEAAAQDDAAAPDSERTTKARKEDKIIVTARKRVETLQETPLSVDVFDSEGLQELGVKDISELSSFTPGFTMEKFGGRRGAEGDTSRPVIRGQANILGETNAAVFVDGVPYSESFLSFPFAAIERIEVVKGPQAALFGRSTFAGAINVITKKGTNEFAHNLTGLAASHGEYEINASTSGPLVKDKVFFFMHGRYYDYGGEYDNTLDGQRVGEEQSWGFNGSLEFRPNENVSVVLRSGYNEDDDNHPAQIVQSRFFNNCFLDQARQYYCGEVQEFDEVTLNLAELGDDAGLKREVFRVTGTLEWDVGGSGYILTSNTGYTSSDSAFGNDQTYLGDLINFAGGIFTRVEEIDQAEWSTELRLDTPIHYWLRGTAGFYYYERDKERFRRRPLSDILIADFGNSFTENWAVFGAIEANVTDALTARAEIRYQEDKIGLDAATGPTLENTFKSVSPRFTLDYQASEDILLYAVAAKGNKPGFINADPSLPESLQFAEEEEAWNYELGAKTNLFGGLVQANVAGYYIDWTNQQLTNSVFVDGIPISVVSNAGETEVTGFEIQTAMQLTEQWSMGLGYAFSDAEIQDFCDPVQGEQLTGFDCTNESGAPGGQTAGNQIPNSPKHHFVATSEYFHPIFGGDYEVFLRGNYSYTSKKFAQVHNLAHTGDRHLLNLQTGIAKGSNWTLTFFVENVLDDRTPSTVVRFADLVNLNTGPNPNPAQDNVPGTTVVERGFLIPLAESRQFGVRGSYNF